ncbi:hypothetical protein AAFF_G00293670 [Aldrovandia affinis]|uniref:Uncharacterized protein n=1 Tax=Aldrovandia affinis TaxID=143900 RepID=A0AAD7R9V3_9TELE|nr:hypothetical protein AAFF_G00293670 [Aldrovandia affinis]
MKFKKSACSSQLSVPEPTGPEEGGGSCSCPSGSTLWLSPVPGSHSHTAVDEITTRSDADKVTILKTVRQGGLQGDKAGPRSLLAAGIGPGSAERRHNRARVPPGSTERASSAPNSNVEFGRRRIMNAASIVA